MTPLPDAMLAHLIRPTGAIFRKSDKAFMPHPTVIAGCDAGASYPA
ncbi:hypothetical protein K6731_04735 [Escherichia whittamii]|uniref:Mannitol-1-phosphate 5-dehydrogenase n=2 Tax=Enterobacteriaceae TaxID=543 RepID=A0ABR8TEE3_9ESCH|nr:hypothetical protein [Escherichia whittamii]MBD7973969.1 hypothetical protein [Escherichia whittamii]MCA4890103.1 hypothetical protein [Escherichia whittamii]